MPFDGVIDVEGVSEDEVFPSLWAAGSRFWVRTRLQRWRSRKEPAVAFSPGVHYAAVALLLEDTKSLIEDRERWLKGTYRWFRGRRCAIGALCAAARKFGDVRIAQSAHSILLHVAVSRHFTCVEGMNDLSSHAEIMSAFDEALALAWARALSADSSSSRREDSKYGLEPADKRMRNGGGDAPCAPGRA